jgi:hypothetical protein
MSLSYARFNGIATAKLSRHGWKLLLVSKAKGFGIGRRSWNYRTAMILVVEKLAGQKRKIKEENIDKSQRWL